jgi:hypothetical protein
MINIIKDYTFHTIKKIQKNDHRYELLLTIPPKEYDQIDYVVYVYMTINAVKDYFLTYSNYEIQLQTFLYSDGVIYGISGHSVTIE